MPDELDLDALRRPLTEIEKAQLSLVCKDVLSPAGLMLLRRALFQLNALAADAQRLRNVLREVRDNCDCCEDAGSCANCERIDAALGITADTPEETKR